MLTVFNFCQGCRVLIRKAFFPDAWLSKVWEVVAPE